MLRARLGECALTAVPVACAALCSSAVTAGTRKGKRGNCYTVTGAGIKRCKASCHEQPNGRRSRAEPEARARPSHKSKTPRVRCRVSTECRVLACLRTSLFRRWHDVGAGAREANILDRRGPLEIHHLHLAPAARIVPRTSILTRTLGIPTVHTVSPRTVATRSTHFRLYNCMIDRSEDAGAFGLSTRLRRACRLPRGC